jgi:hypothetical protein
MVTCPLPSGNRLKACCLALLLSSLARLGAEKGAEKGPSLILATREGLTASVSNEWMKMGDVLLCAVQRNGSFLELVGRLSVAVGCHRGNLQLGLFMGRG